MILILDKKRFRHFFISLAMFCSICGFLWVCFLNDVFLENQIIAEYGPDAQSFKLYSYFWVGAAFVYFLWALVNALKFTKKTEENLEQYIQKIKVSALKSD